MTYVRHDREGFFKYYTPEAAILTLENGSRKWSSPILFNDPFDNQFDLDFPDPTEELTNRNLEQFLAVLRSPEPVRPNQFGPQTAIIEYLRQIHQNNPDIRYTEDKIAELRAATLEGMHNVKTKAPQANYEVRRIMSNASIFCLSERNDSILMWSHYAANHAGVVLKFLALEEVDSPILVAEPVRYSREMPRLNYDILMDSERGIGEIRRTLTLSKSEDWAYEKEWRVCATLRNKTRTYEIIPFAPEEIDEVYLGCKVTDDIKSRILEIVRSKYPRAAIFQAEKHSTKYELVFRELTRNH